MLHRREPDSLLLRRDLLAHDSGEFLYVFSVAESDVYHAFCSICIRVAFGEFGDPLRVWTHPSLEILMDRPRQVSAALPLPAVLGHHPERWLHRRSRTRRGSSNRRGCQFFGSLVFFDHDFRLLEIMRRCHAGGCALRYGRRSSMTYSGISCHSSCHAVGISRSVG